MDAGAFPPHKLAKTQKTCRCGWNPHNPNHNDKLISIGVSSLLGCPQRSILTTQQTQFSDLTPWRPPRPARRPPSPRRRRPASHGRSDRGTARHRPHWRPARSAPARYGPRCPDQQPYVRPAQNESRRGRSLRRADRHPARCRGSRSHRSAERRRPKRRPRWRSPPPRG